MDDGKELQGLFVSTINHQLPSIISSFYLWPSPNLPGWAEMNTAPKYKKSAFEA